MFVASAKEQALTTGKATGASQDPSCCIVGGHGEAVYGEEGVRKERREEARQRSSGYVWVS